MTIPKGITRQDVLEAIRDYDAGVRPIGSGPSIDFDLVYEGRSYPPKVIVGLAARRLNGGPDLYQVVNFSGGDARGAANPVLRDLGFEVARKDPIGETSTPAPGSGAVGQDWTDGQNRHAVESYFSMLHMDLAGQIFLKTEVNAALQALTGRSRSAVEWKFQNISTVVVEEGLPHVQGYLPASGVQQVLRPIVREYLDGPADERARITALLREVPPPVIVTTSTYRGMEVPPPKVKKQRGKKKAPGSTVVAPGKLALADEADRDLGRAGEKWVVEQERQWLHEEGRPDLAAAVLWVADELGDGPGYDVRSYDKDGNERWIEVKTTNSVEGTSFLMSPNERAVWEANQERYEVMRIFSFAKARGYYTLRGDPQGQAEWQVAQWKVTPR